MARKPPTADAPSDDAVSRLIRLLEWGREKGYRIGPIVEIGDIKVQVQDIRQMAREKPVEDDGGPVEHGGVYADAGLTEEDVPVDGTAG